MGKIIERVRYQQLKRAMNEIDERRSVEYLESSKRDREYFAKQMRDFKEQSRMIDERLKAKPEKPKSFIKWLFMGKL